MSGLEINKEMVANIFKFAESENSLVMEHEQFIRSLLYVPWWKSRRRMIATYLHQKKGNNLIKLLQAIK